MSFHHSHTNHDTEGVSSRKESQAASLTVGTTRGSENAESKPPDEITFLYKLVRGVANRSFGLNGKYCTVDMLSMAYVI